LSDDNIVIAPAQVKLDDACATKALDLGMIAA
jgi:hypothetical protein